MVGMPGCSLGTPEHVSGSNNPWFQFIPLESHSSL